MGKKDALDDIAKVGQEAGWIVTARNSREAARIFRQKPVSEQL